MIGNATLSFRNRVVVRSLFRSIVSYGIHSACPVESYLHVIYYVVCIFFCFTSMVFYGILSVHLYFFLFFCNQSLVTKIRVLFQLTDANTSNYRVFSS